MTNSFYLEQGLHSGQFSLCPGHLMTFSLSYAVCNHPAPPEKIESHLPEQGMNGIFKHLRRPGPKGIVVEMGYSKILLDDIPEFGNHDGHRPRHAP
jgi:hypothetical protein